MSSPYGELNFVLTTSAFFDKIIRLKFNAEYGEMVELV